MAEGRSIGTVFVELDLDPSKYQKGQQQLFKDATVVAFDIEKNFKNLGINSSKVFDLMRAQAVNAYQGILHSATSTANDIVRAEEAKNAKITSINEQQFGKQISFIDRLKANWIAASAAIVAAWMLVNKAISYMDIGAQALQVESSFKIMAESAGVNSEKMIASMKAATRATIDDSDLMQKAVKLMTLGYNPEQIERFSKVVITASQIAGTTAAQAYDELSDAIANRMPKALVRMGAVTREQMKIVNAAIESGADSMSLYELAMSNLELKQKMLQGTQDSATISLQRFHAEMKELKETIGKGLIIVVDAAYRSFEYLAAGVLGLVSAYAQYRALVYEVMGDEAKATANREIANAAWAAREELVKKAGQAIFIESEIEEKASKQEIDNSKAKVDAQMEELKRYAEIKAGVEAAKQGKKEWLESYMPEIDAMKALGFTAQSSYKLIAEEAIRNMEIVKGAFQAGKASASDYINALKAVKAAMEKITGKDILNDLIQNEEDYQKKIRAISLDDPDRQKKVQAVIDDWQKARKVIEQMKIPVHADIGPAEAEIRDLITKAEAQGINIKVNIESTGSMTGGGEGGTSWTDYVSGNTEFFQGGKKAIDDMNDSFQDWSDQWGKGLDVPISIYGIGSSRKPISEKIQEIIGEFGSLENAMSGMEASINVAELSMEYQKLDAKLKQVERIIPDMSAMASWAGGSPYVGGPIIQTVTDLIAEYTEQMKIIMMKMDFERLRAYGGSMQTGGVVPFTGLYTLHQGEKVVSKNVSMGDIHIHVEGGGGQDIIKTLTKTLKYNLSNELRGLL